MARVSSLRYVGARYWDRTEALESGEVTPEGLDLTYEVLPLDQVFGALAHDAPFEAAEMSIGTYLVRRDQGDDRFVALPVFPSRAFRHRQLCVHLHSGIESPSDLRGKRFGIAEYEVSAALWIRAFLEHDYGVSARDVEWFVGPPTTPSFRPSRPYAFAPDLRIHSVPAGETLARMARRGDLDATIAKLFPRRETSRMLRRVFEDYRPVEEDWFRRTRQFPIMHVAVLRRDVHERDPEVARALCDAFALARRRAVQQMLDPSRTVVHPWLADDLARQFELFDGDPMRYGYGDNEHVLDAMTAYAHEQGMTRARLRARDLFADSTLDWDPGPDPFRELLAPRLRLVGDG